MYNVLKDSLVFEVQGGEEDCARMQRRLIDLGVQWISGINYVRNTHAKYLFVDNGRMTYLSEGHIEMDKFDKYTLVTLDQVSNKDATLDEVMSTPNRGLFD